MSSAPPQHETPNEPKPKLKIDVKALIDPLIRFFSNLASNSITTIKDIPKIFFSRDLSSWFLLLGFCAGVTLLVITSKQILKRWVPNAHISRPTMVPREEEMLARYRKYEEVVRQQKSLVFLERVIVDLKKNQQESKMKLEIYAECDSPSTALWMKENLAQMQEAILNGAQGETYEGLMTDDGKENLKAAIHSSLNKAYKKARPDDKGKINKVFISHLELGD